MPNCPAITSGVIPPAPSRMRLVPPVGRAGIGCGEEVSAAGIAAAYQAYLEGPSPGDHP
ncbi:hypothetical protein [Streptomyces atrovirens]|uniref:Uncharacterized protein n=1 Tax=Streptomyces atrovirens TaxID=285556 RepID=A0ABW0DRH4_9ACTN